MSGFFRGIRVVWTCRGRGVGELSSRLILRIEVAAMKTLSHNNYSTLEGLFHIDNVEAFRSTIDNVGKEAGHSKRG
jgi:hypothetical protein